MGPCVFWVSQTLTPAPSQRVFAEYAQTRVFCVRRAITTD